MTTLLACAPPGPSVVDATCTPHTGAYNELVRGDGPISSVSLSTDGTSATDLATATNVYVRVAFRDGSVPPHAVLIDIDGDRSTGMWSLQSSLSAAGWNLMVDDHGALHSHTGEQTTWSWEPITVDGFGRRATGDAVEICLPVRTFEGARRISVAAMTDEEHWLPDVFLPGVTFPPDPTAAPTTPQADPAARMGPLAIQYSARPWDVRGCGEDVACAARAYAAFDHVVLGSGLETDDHPGHEGTAALIAAIRATDPATEVWGYVSLVGGAILDGKRTEVYDVVDVSSRAAAWQRIGATGVFIDEADLCRSSVGQSCVADAEGRTVDITRERQNAVFGAIHALGMPVFVNAFSPADVLQTWQGTPTVLGGAVDGRPADVLLLENPTIANGRPRDGLDAAASRARFEIAARLRTQVPVRLAAIDTAGSAIGDDIGGDDYERAYEAARRAGCDIYGFTNGSYSAAPSDSQDLALPSEDPQ